MLLSGGRTWGVEQPFSGDDSPAQGGVIEVRLCELGRFFNTLDPAPFRVKELYRDAEGYILGSAKELPMEAPLALRVYLDRPAGLPDEGRVLEHANRAHFARRSPASRRRLRELVGRVGSVW